MSNIEYDGGEPTNEAVDHTVDSDHEQEARRNERMQALEDEAIESEHIDNFLAGGTHDEF